MTDLHKFSEQSLDVLHCDNHLLVVVKPSGLSTQPHDPGALNLTDIAKAWIKQKFAKPSSVFLEPIHRLDRAVSGIVLFARTSKALSRLQAQMREQRIEKIYVGILEQTPPSPQGTLEHRLVHEEYRARVDPLGKVSILEYRVVGTQKEGCLVRFRLITGRYHQIRAQCAAIGCPIRGDKKYGARHSLSTTQIFLHHEQLSFAHPVTNEMLCFRSSPAWA